MTDGGGEGAGVAEGSANAAARLGLEASRYRRAQRAVGDPARLAAVRATGLLDTDAEAVFDRLTRLAVRLVGVPSAFISLVDEHRDFYKSACGFGELLASARELTGPTFCHYTIEAAVPLVIPDTAADPAYRDMPTVRSLGVAAYVGVPLMVHGQAVGSFCAVDTRPRAWTADELEILTELAAAAEREVELRIALRATGMMNEQLQEQAVELEAQSEELQATAAHLEEQTEFADAQRQVAETARARMTGVLESMSDAYFALDADFRITAVNVAMERNVGQPRAALVGRSMWEAFPGTVGNVFERSYRSAATDGKATHFTHDYSDGRLELVSEVDVYPSEGGGVAVFWRDVAARERLFNDAQVARRDAEAARAEAEAARAEAEAARGEAESARGVAEAANHAKAEFLANMSHELRTPLNAIGGYAELLEMGIRGPVTDEQRVDLGRIQQSQRHLLGLVNEILDLATVDAGGLHVESTVVRAGDTIDAALALVRPQAAAKALALDGASGDIADLSYHGDERRGRQVLVNLLSNAIKFTPPGGRVTVGCRLADARPGGRVLAPGVPYMAISVEDSGAGMPPEQLERIFEPFTQLERGMNPYTRQTAGTGLGLTISRRLSRLMGGDLTVESRLGHGSVFTLWLPTTDSGAIPPEHPDRDPATAGETGAHLAGVDTASAVRAELAPSPQLAATLARIGAALTAEAGLVIRAWVERLRADPLIPTEGRTDIELEDHAATLVTDAGLGLRTLAEISDEHRGEAGELLRDSRAILAILGERHGAQRARLGWPVAAVPREFAILAEVLGETVRGLVGEADVAAAERVHAVIAQMLAQAERVSLSGFRVSRVS